MLKKTIAHAGPQEFTGKRVLVRVDFNVPQNPDGSISDDSRIRASLDTIRFLKDAGARIILVSHLGRPKGGPENKYSLRPVVSRLSELLGCGVKFMDSCTGDATRKAVNDLKNGEICLLENLRFHSGEEKNDPDFAKDLAFLADVYVNDAFGTAHRAHASTHGVSKHLSPSLAGLLLHKEIKALHEVLHSPARPFATIIGGAKVSSKIGVLKSLVDKADIVIIGGAMAFSFLKSMGKEVGKSLVENDKLDLCRELIRDYESRKVKLLLPIDVVCAPEMKPNAPSKTCWVDAIQPDQMGLDVGPSTIDLLRDELSVCKSILWNGPLGAFEYEGFEHGTFALVDLLAELTSQGAKTVIGGGDSLAAIEAHGVSPDSFTHVSTGGGAALEFIEGLELPGVACLDEAESVASPT